jgi:hypothetical protein
LRPILTLPFVAAAAIAGHRFVKLTGGLAQSAAATDLGIGISDRMGAAQGGMCDVHVVGTATVCAGGAFAVGKQLISDADGKAIEVPAPAGGAVRVRVVAIALEAATAEDDLVQVMLAQSETFVPAA